MTLFSTGWF